MLSYNALYEKWALRAARIFLAIQFAAAAYFKIIGFSSEAQQTAAVGVPWPSVAVALALILELAGVIALLTGYKIRLLAGLLAPYIALLAVLFYHNWSNPMTMGLFISHLGLIAALLYVSVYGARSSDLSQSR